MRKSLNYKFLPKRNKKSKKTKTSRKKEIIKRINKIKNGNIIKKINETKLVLKPEVSHSLTSGYTIKPQ